MFGTLYPGSSPGGVTTLSLRYTDDQIYFPLNSGHDSLHPLFEYLEELWVVWMEVMDSFLKLNETKTEVRLLSLVPLPPNIRTVLGLWLVLHFIY